MYDITHKRAPVGHDTAGGLKNDNITDKDYTRDLLCIARRSADRARLEWRGFLPVLATNCEEVKP